MNDVEQMKSKILELDEKLKEKHPQMPNLLALIHRELNKNPQLISSLTDEDISIITQGLASYTKTEIITAKAKKKSPTAALKKTSVADLL